MNLQKYATELETTIASLRTELSSAQQTIAELKKFCSHTDTCASRYGPLGLLRIEPKCDCGLAKLLGGK